MPLPQCSELNSHEDENVRQNWKRSIHKFDNMFEAMDFTRPSRKKKAILVHYADGEVTEVVQTLELCKGDNEENCFDNLCDGLDSCFQPMVNKRMLVFKFGSATQSKNENSEDYVIR